VSTKLEVSFDWENQRMPGKATITFHPHFYPTDTLTLDAKGFDIHKIEMVTANGNKPLHYTYDSSLLNIFLDRMYTRNENYTLFIDYTAKPNERKTTGGSLAITDTKGLYFINPKGEELNKPKQIWTQGETEYNSAWYPTIDKPDMKTTIEISMTVDTQYVTLSNGLMIDSHNNGNGTRTDHWKLDQPIAPYLVMMAVGKFSIIKDKWRNIDVNYYVEPKYAPFAKEIFGDTPDMIEFYSKKLGVDFPWPKFSQIVVRDFVSGAMENATAVVHYDALEQTHREMIDGKHEDIICHELFHHWFGDLVTCESWANLPLNESFADFSESLWLGHRYGKDEGDYHMYNGLQQYLNSAKKVEVPLIRYYYKDKENMFDANSYQKGGNVLNMLRNYVGDDAFYKSLNLYLTANKYKTGEIHQLRLAFEEVTGEDLNWFFNEWFLSKGNPDVVIDYSYNDSSHTAYVGIEQVQAIENKLPVFRMPLKVDIYFGDTVKHYNIVVDKEDQIFSFPAYSKPDLINVDADKSIVWSKVDNNPDSAFMFQYFHAPLVLDRLEAVEHFKGVNGNVSSEVLMAALHDKFWRIRKECINEIDLAASRAVQFDIINLAKADPSTEVRAAALKKLGDLNNKSLLSLFANAMKDSSYLVLETALDAISTASPDTAFEIAKNLKNESEEKIVSAVAPIFAATGDREYSDWFLSRLKNQEGYAKFTLYIVYGRFLSRMDEETQNKGLLFLYTAAVTDEPWTSRYGAMNAIGIIRKGLQDEKDKFTGSVNSDNAKIAAIESRINAISLKMYEIQMQETDKTLKSMYSR
jgi:aminopeptidase N